MRASLIRLTIRVVMSATVALAAITVLAPLATAALAGGPDPCQIIDCGTSPPVLDPGDTPTTPTTASPTTPTTAATTTTATGGGNQGGGQGGGNQGGTNNNQDTPDDSTPADTDDDADDESDDSSDDGFPIVIVIIAVLALGAAGVTGYVIWRRRAAAGSAGDAS